MSYIGNFPKYSVYVPDTFVGDGTQTTFVMSNAAATSGSILVIVDGVKQFASSYSVSGTSLIFSEAPAEGSVIEVINLATKGVLNTVADDSINNDMLQANSVEPDNLTLETIYAIVGEYGNLIIENNVTTPNSQVDINVNEIILKNSDGRAFLASAVDLTANITISGVNGLDSGAEAVSTWYYLWVIYNGTTVSSLISLSNTNPTLPSGYTYKALVGAIYNDVSGNFIKIYQSGNRVRRTEISVSTSVPGTSYASVSLAAAIPPNAKFVDGHERFSLGASVTATYFIAPTSSDNLTKTIALTSGGTTATSIPRYFNEPLVEAQIIYTKRAGTAVSAYEMIINGWEY